MHRPDRPSTSQTPGRDRARRAPFPPHPTMRVITSGEVHRDCPATTVGFVALLAAVKAEARS